VRAEEDGSIRMLTKQYETHFIGVCEISAMKSPKMEDKNRWSNLKVGEPKKLKSTDMALV